MRNLLLALLLTIPAAAQSAEAFWQTLPAPKIVEKGERWLLTAPNDPLLLKHRQDHDQDPSIAFAMRQLKAEHGNDTAALQKDPRYQQLLALGYSDQPAVEIDYGPKIRAYAEQTKSWLKRNHFAGIKGWKGTMVVLLDGKLNRARTLVEFQASNSFYQTDLARQCWTGTFKATFENQGQEPQPLRTIEMNDKAHAQMFLGQEGWNIKFKEIRSNNYYVPLPTLSNVLLNLPWLEESKAPEYLLTGQTQTRIDEKIDTTSSPDAYLQGYPLDPTSLRQRGAIQYKRPSGVEVRVGWDFAPIP